MLDDISCPGAESMNWSSFVAFSLAPFITVSPYSAPTATPREAGPPSAPASPFAARIAFVQSVRNTSAFFSASSIV